MTTQSRFDAPAPHGGDMAAGANAPTRPHRARRVVAILAVVLLGLVAVFYVAGGWYFSNKIWSGGLELNVSTGVPDYDLTITALDGDTVTLAAKGDAPLALTQPSYYALMWSGGSAHVGPAIDVPSDATTVTRSISDITGTPPAVGTAAALDRDWYLGDPKTSLGLDFTEVSVAGALGPLPAWYVPAQGTTWAVMIHGKGGLRREFLRTLPLVHAAGLPALVVTYRNDYGNAQDPNPVFGYGATEWPDLEAAVDYATAHGATKVLIYANSMGSAITASYLQHSPRTSAITAVVLDAPLLSLSDGVYLGASKMSLPVIGSVPDSLTWVAERIAALRFGIDWSALDYASDPSWVRMPILVMHGVEDPTAPVTTSERFAAMHPDLVTLHTFADAAHVESWNTERMRYETTVGEFLMAHRGA
jgi:uncharacterized protein